MNIRDQLLLLIETYGTAKGISGSRVTTLAMNSGGVYARLVDGGDITLGRVERAVQWLSTHWPADLDWPAGVPRPAVQSVSPASSLEEEVA